MNNKHKNVNAKQISTAKPDEKSSGHWLMMLGLLLAVLFGQAFVIKAADYTVTNTSDSGAGSLRDAINQANAASPDDVISFDPTIFAAHQTITLGGTELVIQNNGSLTINGPVAGVTISGNNASRVLLNLYATVNLQNLTITGGAQGLGPGINGAGIYNTGGTMTLTKVTVSGNTAPSGYSGGGIHNDGGTLTLTDSTISNNSASEYGGGINNYFGTLKLNNSTVSGNSAAYGGGIDNYLGTLTLVNSTVNNNSASEYGGGIFNAEEGTATITNSTISGNTAGLEGGGINLKSGTLTLSNSTVTNNRSEFGAIRNVGGTVNVRSTIIAGNIDSDGGDAPDVAGAFISQGYNLIGASDYSTGFVNGVNNDQVGSVAYPINPMLGPLQNNGGPTFTHALLPGSPAIDAGNSTLKTDQRGFLRPVDQPDAIYPNADGGNAADIGAFEVQNTPPVAQCKNVTVTLAPGQMTAPADINNGSSDPDGDTLSLMYNPAGPYPAGQTVVALTVDDGKGGMSFCMGTVTVKYQFKWYSYSDLLSSQQYFNQVTAGSIVAVRFSLNGFQGYPYSQAPTSQPIICTTKASLGPATPADVYAPDPYYSSLYDFYQTTWGTQLAWKNTCRRLTLYFKDGSTQTLDYYFK